MCAAAAPFADRRQAARAEPVVIAVGTRGVDHDIGRGESLAAVVGGPGAAQQQSKGTIGAAAVVAFIVIIAFVEMARFVAASQVGSIAF